MEIYYIPLYPTVYKTNLSTDVHTVIWTLDKILQHSLYYSSP